MSPVLWLLLSWNLIAIAIDIAANKMKGPYFLPTTTAAIFCYLLGEWLS